MNKKLLWTTILLLVVLFTCHASSEVKSIDTKTDSLRKELGKNKGSDKISTQLELALHIMGRDKDEAQRLADSALYEAKIAGDKNLEMQAYYILGRTSDLSGTKDLSMSYYEAALKLSVAEGDNEIRGEILFRIGLIKHNNSEEVSALEYFNASLQASRLSDNFKVMGSAYSMMGTIFRINGLYDRAIEHTVSSKLYYEKAGFSEGSAWAAYLLGRVYSDLKLNQKALEYFQEALNIYTRQSAVDGINDGVAMCYEQIGLLNLASGNYQEALKYIEMTKEIYADNKSEYGLSNSNKNMGIIAYSMGNYDLAVKYLNESLNAKLKLADKLNLATIYEYLGLCLIGMGQTEEGFSNLNKGLNLAIANNQTRIQLNIYSELTSAYLNINDLKNAISCQEKQIEIQDLILSGAANIKIEQLQTIYEIDKQNEQIAELERQNEINSMIIKQHRISQQIMIAGILIAILFSITIFWFFNKIRHKNRELREINAAKDKFFAIIAHDLRGPTGNLASFIEHLNETFNQHSPEELKKILLLLYKSAESVSLLLENLLLWARSQLNKIEFKPEELKLSDILTTSVKGLSQAADSKQIDVRLELDDQIYVMADNNMVQIIIRNIFSNAIKFTPRGGLVIIRSDVRDSHRAVISITDNGVGIDNKALSEIFDIASAIHTSGTENEKSSGLGLILVKEFIDKNKGTITINSQKDKGTVVSFTLPLIKKQR